MKTSDTAYFYSYFQAELIPDISLRGAKSVTADPLSGIEIATNVALPPCAPQSAYNFEFFWRQTLGIGNTPEDFDWDDISSWDVNSHSLYLGNAVTRKNLVINEGNLQYDSHYTFQLTVIGDGYENDFNFVGIKTNLRPLAEAILFTEEKPISTDQAVDISGLDYFI